MWFYSCCPRPLHSSLSLVKPMNSSLLTAPLPYLKLLLATLEAAFSCFNGLFEDTVTRVNQCDRVAR